MGAKLVLVELHAANDRRSGLVDAEPVGHAKSGSLDDTGEAGESLFYALRPQLRPAEVQDLFLSSRNDQQILPGHAPDVPRIEPAVAKYFCGLLRVAQISADAVGTAQAHNAFGAA